MKFGYDRWPEELWKFKDMTKKVYEKCHIEFRKNEDCQLMAMQELKFIDMIRSRQNLRARKILQGNRKFVDVDINALAPFENNSRLK